MPRRQPSKSAPEELPPCEGPKLCPFEHRSAKIRWLQRLDGDDDRSSPAQGFVFRARIKGRDYAIKIVRVPWMAEPRHYPSSDNCTSFKFKFYDPTRVKRLWKPLVGSDVSLETTAYYSDPFYNECRAYGRINDDIKKKKLKPNIVIPCYGYMYLSKNDQRILEDRGMDLQLGEVPWEYQQGTLGGCRARALVKSLASGEPGVNGKTINSVLHDIMMLNYRGVYNMDIRLDNFRDSKLVEFGSSRTDPHIFFEKSSDVNADADRVADRTMFDEMVEEEGIPISKEKRTVHCMRLRRRRR